MPLHEHPAVHYLCSDILAETQHTIVRAIRDLVIPREPRPVLLDVGCWDGTGTVRYGSVIGAETHGIEIFQGAAKEAEAKGVQVAALDLEQSPFPWAANRFDVVVANQVFEHLKNIWLPLAECHRVLRPGGHFVISVPNLASVHNRVLLGLGRQPTSIRTLGAHVRGFTLRELTALVTLDGAFEIRAVTGAGFYPFLARMARPIARLWPGGSHTVVVVARKALTLAVSPWQRYRERAIETGEQTFYG